VARAVKPEEHARKRNEILDAAQNLVFTQGFENIAVRDILDALHISSGAFHHYFGSRDELAGALIERIRQETEKPLLLIVQNDQFSAVEKIQAFFQVLDELRAEQGQRIASVMRVWYSDANAIIREKVDDALRKYRGPMLVEIIRQGVKEGLFRTEHPEAAGEVVLSILHGMGDSLNKELLMLDARSDTQDSINRIASIHSATLDAIERVLGVPTHTFARTEPKIIRSWILAFKKS
jgi:AcrR family transcriptional regulator